MSVIKHFGNGRGSSIRSRKLWHRVFLCAAMSVGLLQKVAAMDDHRFTPMNEVVAELGDGGLMKAKLGLVGFWEHAIDGAKKHMQYITFEQGQLTMFAWVTGIERSGHIKHNLKFTNVPFLVGNGKAWVWNEYSESPILGKHYLWGARASSENPSTFDMLYWKKGDFARVWNRISVDTAKNLYPHEFDSGATKLAAKLFKLSWDPTKEFVKSAQPARPSASSPSAAMRARLDAKIFHTGKDKHEFVHRAPVDLQEPAPTGSSGTALRATSKAFVPSRLREAQRLKDREVRPEKDVVFQP